MKKINPSMRLKVNRDTFFLPDSNKGVYFRNNLTSFRMEGETIHQWIEKLIPVFDGTNTLEYLTNSLPDAYKNRVYEIAQVLYKNGFVRDVSHDLTHQLSDTILNKYASEIEFLDNISDSGGYRFQTYRQAKVLVIGSGPLLLSLVISLIRSGLTNFSIIITNFPQTDLRRIEETISEARKSEPDTEINFLKPDNNSWRLSLKPFNSILYGSLDDDLAQLRLIQAICKEEKKDFLPITISQGVAFAGPLVHPESEGCWESVYRRLHQRPCEENNLSNSFSPTAGALLANVMVFELFKKITGVMNKKEKQFYLLNLETLEGNWHTFLPHPLVTGSAYTEHIKDPLPLIEKNQIKQRDLHSLFNELTSKESGVFHLWEEADLIQLPLSQCKVQAVDPLSEGPAQLSPQFVCSGLTHEEARREAGLYGIESYIRGFVNDDSILNKHLRHFESCGIGTGETAAESLCRALQNWLSEEFVKQVDIQMVPAFILELGSIEDKRCRFLLRTLTTLRADPEIHLGNDVFGFPVVWVGSNGYWYGSCGLDLTMAISRALQIAIMDAQNKESFRTPYGIVVSAVNLRKNSSMSFPVPSLEERPQKEIFLSSLQLLRQNKKRVHIFDLNLEPIFKERTAGIYGISVREEELK
ncbi:putative thiazole-containing bacteriocin maturation protein [Bacillus sp. FSL K6-4563]|uniref:putative thiazole-containing bacteriocin maturation protein n=1 Tax=Bacillus sp. FSL K6-4563 TaxID=2921507 RepID=UPI00315AF70D